MGVFYQLVPVVVHHLGGGIRLRGEWMMFISVKGNLLVWIRFSIPSHERGLLKIIVLKMLDVTKIIKQDLFTHIIYLMNFENDFGNSMDKLYMRLSISNLACSVSIFLLCTWRYDLCSKFINELLFSDNGC